MLEVSEARLASLSPAKRKLAEAALAELARTRDENPLQFVHVCAVDCGVPGCRPYRHQAEFTAALTHQKAFFGGNGAGKTQVGIIDDLIQLVDEAVLPPRLLALKRWKPPFFLRIVAPKLAVIEGAILPKLRALTPASQLRGGSFDKAYDKRHQKLWFQNGSWVLFNTSDQDVDAHAGVSLHRCHFDEEPEGNHGRDIYLENWYRLRDYMPNAQLMFTMTPLFGMSWMYDEIWEKRDDPQMFCTTASLLDNPWIDGAALVEASRGSMSEAELAARVEGRFVHFHGSVINVTEEHRVDPPTEQHVRDLQTYVGIDPGMARGGVVWVGFDRGDDGLVYDELYPSGQSVPSLALDIILQNARWGIGDERERRAGAQLIRAELEDGLLTSVQASEKIKVLRAKPPGPRVIYIIDPSARNRSLTDAQRVEGEFQRVGIYTLPGQNDRRAGVMAMRARLEHKALLVSRECTNWIRESERWLVDRDESTDEQRSNAGGSDTFATKGPDHLMDPTRYVCMERIWWRKPSPVRPQPGQFAGVLDSRVGFMTPFGGNMDPGGSPLGSMS